MNPSATASAMEPLARQMRVMYGAMTPEQLGLQTGKALTGMMSHPADVERATVWASRSDAAAAGQAFYELMTTDLRNDVANITSDVLLVAATKIVASNPDRLEMALTAYRAQVARIRRHRVVAATHALHFIMLDDPAFLLSTMDDFLRSATADRTPAEAQ
jgi:pimeloyl-ACP methyl ester carboxylesterase